MTTIYVKRLNTFLFPLQLQSLNKIIQRDFFPELPKLRAQHEYLDAVEHNDLEKLREISARYQVSHTPSGSSRLGKFLKVKRLLSLKGSLSKKTFALCSMTE